MRVGCWYLPLGRSGINLRLRERRLDKVSFPNTAGDCRIPRSTGGNPHACWLLVDGIEPSPPTRLQSRAVALPNALTNKNVD